MHRYRDAIYYNSLDYGIKREIVGGYVLYPGNLTADQVRSSYYHTSHEKIGIGAFPLKPGASVINENGELELDPMSSEKVLYEQIAAWLKDDTRRENLLEKTIPQKGLEYTNEKVIEGCYFLSTIDTKVNTDIQKLKDGKGKSFVTGYAALTSGINMQKTKYLAIVDNHEVKGYYTIESMKVVDKKEMLELAREASLTDKRLQKYKGYDVNYRMEFLLGEYKALSTPFVYGIPDASKGHTMTKKEFREYCKGLNG